MSLVDVIIIGAGAAGLFCAREAAARGRRVTVIDHSDVAGRKILISGGGRCNFTNLSARPDAYVSANPHFCKSALAGFTARDFIRLVESRRIRYHEKAHGQLFCDGSAEAIRDMLVAECRKEKVEILLSTRINGVRREDDLFHVDAGERTIAAPRLVVATGGLSAPQTGATGFGHDLARQFGLNVIAPEPALVGLTWNSRDRPRWSKLSGVTLPDVAVSCGKQTFREGLLFTRTGLSGPAILQASLYRDPGDEIAVDLLPDVDVRERLLAMREDSGRSKPARLLAENLPKSFASRFATIYLPDAPLARISDSEIASIAERVGHWSIDPTGTEGYGKAEVTRGGVDTEELSSRTMESRKVPGLFFIGEVVDVTGRLGGYNFQWAWSSAVAAGRAV